MAIQPRIERYIRSLVLHRDDASDVIQETAARPPEQILLL
jgi:DNA-directed RNA polymerase specialized sigma24 family protein